MEFERPQQEEIYRTDGRLYEISVQENVLKLGLRKSVVLERRLIAVLSGLLLFSLGVVWQVLVHLAIPGAPSFCEAFFTGIPQFLFYYSGPILVLILLDKSQWTFEKRRARLFYGRSGKQMRPLARVRALKAWRRGNKFYLLLQTEKDGNLPIGRFGFATQERAWRDDATRIAEFLNVPLEISPSS